MVERKHGGRGNKPHRCDGCRRAHLKAADRDRGRRRAEAKRPTVCERCGGELEARSHRRTPLCLACYAEHRRAGALTSQKRRIAAKPRHCKDCGVPIAFNGKRTPRRCEACRAKRYKNLILAKQWSMSREQYDTLFAAQGHCCAICKGTHPGKRGWCVDHDHGCCSGNASCGTCVRGLLCTPCNLLLGAAKDNPEVLLRAVEYLRRPSKARVFFNS